MNNQTDDVAIESLMTTLAEDIAKFAPDKRAHFLHVLRALVDCYLSDAKQGIVLLRDDASESEAMTLMAVNADPSQADDLIDMLCQLRGIGTAHSAGAAVN